MHPRAYTQCHVLVIFSTVRLVHVAKQKYIRNDTNLFVAICMSSSFFIQKRGVKQKLGRSEFSHLLTKP